MLYRLNGLARHRKATLAAGLKFLPTMLSCGHYLDYKVKSVLSVRCFEASAPSRCTSQSRFIAGTASARTSCSDSAGRVSSRVSTEDS